MSSDDRRGSPIGRSRRVRCHDEAAAPILVRPFIEPFRRSTALGPNHFHFPSILRSWLNAVEDSTLAKPPLKRGVLRSVADLQAAINRFLDNCDTAAKPFIWTGDPDKIIAAVSAGTKC